MIKMSIKIPANSFGLVERLAPKGLFILLLVLFFMSIGLKAGERGALPGTGPGSAKLIASADQLPAGVKRMHQALVLAVRSGNIEQMREVLQMNELMPLINGQFIHDPVKHWSERSFDGSGRDVLALLSEILELPPVKIIVKRQAFYIWPYFARRPLDKLSPRELVRLYRLAPASKTAIMLKNNRYSHTQIMLGADGTWHSIELPREKLLEKSPQKP